MIDLIAAIARGAAELMFVFRGRSLAAVAVIFGFVVVSITVWMSSALGKMAGVVVVTCVISLVAAIAFASRKSMRNRIVRNMAERDTVNRGK